MEETRVCCTYCDSPEPAVRTCLQCEASFCEKHLHRHSKSSEHILVDPDTTRDMRWRYWMWPLRSAVEKMYSDKMEVGKRIQNLTDHGVHEENKLSGLTEKVTNLFTELRETLDDLESRVLGEISRQKDQVSLSVSDMIRQVELHKDELSKKIHQFEESCDITDPLTFLQEDLFRGLLRFADDLKNLIRKKQFPVMKKSEVLLDIDSAHDNIIISQSLRSASYTATSQNRPEGPKRFKVAQVLSSCSFSSGRHYWEVDVSQAKQWIIGVAGDSLERKSPVKVVGIYLDYEAGRLSFYQLCDPIRHLHTFTTSFTEPLYAAFYLYENCVLRILK
ncbi:hypothetical protein GDO81_023405 [Engystomops pustulosus]|uniref:B30.2/SPRY domain-containing protein n=1 Tax=Engystomops pustulosus TaxID=76066 RepID=A0AAV6ZIQ5_ENGPU|nr:hypothetical protein GDO81_023405 [Engystomops pustulosus]